MVEQAGVGGAAWSPDSRWIAVPSPRGISIRAPHGGEEKVIGAARQQISFGTTIPLTWSRQGELFYVTANGPISGHGVWATQVREDGSGMRQTPLETSIAFPAFSPDGWPLVFATGPYDINIDGSRSGPPSGLRVIDGPGEKPRELIATTGMPDSPVFSPDGRQIVFKQWLKGGTELWSVGADGSGAHRLARALFIRDYSFSPDGRRVAFTGVDLGGSGGLRLHVVPLTGAKARLVGEDTVAYGPTWSPDGHWITYSNSESEIKRIHPDGRRAETLAYLGGDEGRGMLWSPDGRFLAYSATPPFEYTD